MKQKSLIFTLANAITVLGIVFACFAFPLLQEGIENGFIHWKGLFLLFLAFLTDFFDGLAARKLHQESHIGRQLDPLRDKLIMVWGGFILLDITFFILLCVLELISALYAWKTMRLHKQIYIPHSSKWISTFQALVGFILFFCVVESFVVFVLLCSLTLVSLSFWRMMVYRKAFLSRL